MTEPSANDLRRFWSKVRIGENCWEWTAYKMRGAWPYGQVVWGGKTRLAHRVSYELAHGSVPEGLQVDHICSNALCVRPDHLRAVTNKQNSEHHKGANKNSASGVRNVLWANHAKKWRVIVTAEGRNIHGGYFDTIAEAEEAAIALRRLLFTHSDPANEPAEANG